MERLWCNLFPLVGCCRDEFTIFRPVRSAWLRCSGSFSTGRRPEPHADARGVPCRPTHNPASHRGRPSNAAWLAPRLAIPAPRRWARPRSPATLPRRAFPPWRRGSDSGRPFSATGHYCWVSAENSIALDSGIYYAPLVSAVSCSVGHRSRRCGAVRCNEVRAIVPRGTPGTQTYALLASVALPLAFCTILTIR